MKIQRIAVGITVLNLILMTIFFAQFRQANAKEQSGFIAPILRGRALEITDSLGRVRASISLQPPVTLDGKQYPETILFRLISAEGKPVVKIAAEGNSGSMSLVNISDEGIIIKADNSGSVVKMSYKGKERVLAP
jgi:hypothetical protein